MSRRGSFGVDKTAHDLIQPRRGTIQPPPGARVSDAPRDYRCSQDDRYCEHDPEQHGVSPTGRSGVPP